MYPVTIHVAIVGLCTLMNVHNADTSFLPPPSLIIPKADLQHGGIAEKHTGFIGWNTRYVTSSGVTTTPVLDPKNNSTDYVYTALDGDFIEIADLPHDANKQLDLTKFLGIATHSQYWDNVPPPRAYDSHFVPLGLNRMGTPDENYVAGYFRFGTEGSLESSHPTTQDWIFRNQKTSYTIKRTFNQQADYYYEAALNGNGYAVITITLKDLANTSSDRTITLTGPLNAGLTFFIGNATAGGMYYLLAGKDPAPEDQCRADHFQAIHMIAHTANKKENPIPEPEHIGANCADQEPQQAKTGKQVLSHRKGMKHALALPLNGTGGAAGDSTGYCGPDSKP